MNEKSNNMNDDDDIFHDVIMSEERGQKEGFDEGKSEGNKLGLQEGYRLGWEKGSSIGSEVGFYNGYAMTLLEELTGENEATPNQRVLKGLQRIQTLCGQFPLTDPLSPDLQNKLEEIRAKFKQVCSMLGIKSDEKKSGTEKGFSF